MMATSRRLPKRPRKEPISRAAPQPDVAFRRVWVTRAAMQEVPKVEAPNDESNAERYPLELGIGAKVLVSDKNVGRVVMNLSVTGDPRVKPYKVHLEIVGEFATRRGGRAEVIAFCQEAGPTLLFPYARQIIDRMTSDGFYGPLRLDPIYLRQMLTAQGWKEEQDEAGAAPGTGSSPTEIEPHE